MVAATRSAVGLLAIVGALCCAPSSAQDYRSWETYGGDDGNSHYSSLKQINRANVQKLALAWSYSSAKGQSLPATSELQINPIIVDGVLYGRNPTYNVFALEADTGNELWSHSPSPSHVGLSNMRGITHWQNDTQARLFFYNRPLPDGAGRCQRQTH